MGDAFIGRSTAAVAKKVRGERGSRIRKERGMIQRVVKRPHAEPGQTADRAEQGFNRTMREFDEASSFRSKESALTRGRAALSRYEKVADNAAKSMQEAQARLNAVSPVTPAQIEAAGYADKGGKLVPKFKVVKDKATGKVRRVQDGFTRVGRDRKALAGTVDLQTHKRLKREAQEATDRHAAIQRRLSEMRSTLAGKRAEPPTAP